MGMLSHVCQIEAGNAFKSFPHSPSFFLSLMQIQWEGARRTLIKYHPATSSSEQTCWFSLVSFVPVLYTV